ncbi:hypothetical protein HCN44_003379 [Aphidius gifuensis]|uniref:Regulatory protein zeste n=1 Tax=Aphidius gifuensis TaxID=684658 RepID=A0A835CRU8_APHGI|nr:hypothetical protein HCN44_003379 [Aphidius gifuensis]
MSEVKKTKAARPATANQKDLLTKFVTQNPSMMTLKFSAQVTKDSIKKKWEEVSLYLNSVENGAMKTPTQWRKSIPPASVSGIEIDESLAEFDFKNIKHDYTLTEVPAMYDDLSGTNDLISSSYDNVLIDSDDESYQVDNYSYWTNDENKPLNFLNTSKDIKENSKTIVDMHHRDDIHCTPKNVKPEMRVNKQESKSDINLDISFLDQVNTLAVIKEDTKSKLLIFLIEVKHEQLVTSEFKAFPPKKRTHSAQRQVASIHNSEKMLGVAAADLSTKKLYYEQKILLMSRETKLKNFKLRILIAKSNRLTKPW